MKVIKKVNNNVAIAINDNNEEVFVVGKGVGFPKTPYQLTETDMVVEKIFVAPKNIRMYDLLNSIPIEHIYLAEEVITMGSDILHKTFNTNLLLTLSDHISFALARTREGVSIKNPLEWEVRTLYPDETRVGEAAVRLIEATAGVRLPAAETTLIALHFVNAQVGSGEMSDTTKITTVTGEMLSIIKYALKIDFEEESIHFMRFATHVRYFIMRQMSGKSLKKENEALFEMVTEKFPRELECVEKIAAFLQNNYGWSCTNDEKLYLILHIQRLISND
ncbi:transcriptional antiterminator BglG [Paenibacillus sp. FSL R7-277]|uniref:PRD domain-containing protein n=1 Tax=unclassified Paenibacillus TaxID=185978 RepID=UPI0003E1CFA4|nr:PRD domain-containing protein [Paenibacillus sp. FSL R7-277]ETT63628.1 transcriptional antiterminator BglG [Paenibacillus sp. FSL R7-277]OMG02305.1 beta-glucoside operon antiterminator [Paenibacillus sp. FSL R7-0333]